MRWHSGILMDMIGNIFPTFSLIFFLANLSRLDYMGLPEKNRNSYGGS